MTVKWLIVDQFRRKLLRRWTILASLIVVILVLQSLMGQYTGMVSFIWLWGLLCVFTGWLLLLLSSWLNKRPDKLITKQVSSTLNWLSVLYLLLVLLTIFMSEASVYRTGWSLKQYFSYSLYWLTIPNLAVSAGFYLSLFRQKEKHIPNASILNEKVAEMLQQATEEGRVLKEQVLNFVAQGELKSAADLLDAAKLNKVARNHQILLKGQLTKLQQDIDLGVISSEEAQLRTNKLTLSILNLVDGLGNG